MNYTNYIGLLRYNLCHVLTMLRNNEKKIKKLRESVENLEITSRSMFPSTSKTIDKELNREIEFYEILNGVYEKEVNRLVTIILGKPTGV